MLCFLCFICSSVSKLLLYNNKQMKLYKKPSWLYTSKQEKTMSSTGELDIVKIEDEILNKLRFAINQYDTKNRVTETIRTHIGNGTTQLFLAHSTQLDYIKSVTIDGEQQVHGKDYEIVWRNLNDYGTTAKGNIYFFNAPTNGTEIIITYGQNNGGSFVYPDFPKAVLGESQFPRVGFQLTFAPTDGGGGAGRSHVLGYEGLLQIMIVDTYSKNTSYLATKIKTWFAQNCKNFYYVQYIQPTTIREYDIFNNNADKDFRKMVELRIPNRYEVVQFAQI